MSRLGRLRERARGLLTGPRVVTALMVVAIAILLFLVGFAFFAVSNRNEQLAREARAAAERNEEIVREIRTLQEFNKQNLVLHRRNSRATIARLAEQVARQHARLLEALGVEEETAERVFGAEDEPGTETRSETKVDVVHVHHDHFIEQHEHHHHHHHHPDRARCDTEANQAAHDAGVRECQ